MRKKTAATFVCIMLVGAAAAQGVVQHKAQGKSAINSDLVDGLDASAFALKTGADFTGNISMDGNQINNVGSPKAPTDAVPKKYVDTNGIGNLSKTLSINNKAGDNNINLSGNEITNVSRINGQLVEDLGTSNLSEVLQENNEASTNINMSGNRITNLSDPENPEDAATKSYVDTTDDTIQDNQGLEDVLSLDNRVGGQNINFNETSNIQAQGTNAITLDNNQNIGIANGNLSLENGDLNLNGNDVYTDGGNFYTPTDFSMDFFLGGGTNTNANRFSFFDRAGSTTELFTITTGGEVIVQEDDLRLSGGAAIQNGENTDVVRVQNNGNAVIPNGNLNLGNNNLTNTNTIQFNGNPQIGENSQATGERATALGELSKATGTKATALGQDSQATADFTTAIGRNSQATQEQATAIGQFSQATQEQATAIGQFSRATQKQATAIGEDSQAADIRSTAIGRGSEAISEGAVAIGDRANAPNTYEATFGNLNGQRLDVNITRNLTVHQDANLKGGLYDTSSDSSFFDGGCSEDQYITGITSTGQIQCSDEPDNTDDDVDNTELNNLFSSSGILTRNADGTYTTTTDNTNPINGNLNAGNGLTGGQNSVLPGNNDVTLSLDANDLDQNGNINSDSVGISETTDNIADGRNTASLGGSGGWYRIASNGPVANGANGGNRASATFIVEDRESGQHSTTMFHASVHYGNQPTLSLVSRSSYSSDGLIERVRLVSGGTYEGAAVEVYVDGEGDPGNVEYQIYNDVQSSGWSPVDWNSGNVPNGFRTTNMDLRQEPVIATATNGGGINFEVGRDGAISSDGNGVDFDEELYVDDNEGVFVQGEDLAERYRSSQELEAGAIVSISQESDDSVVRTTQRFGSTAGVVSTQPGYTLGWNNESAQQYPIALTGKVPVKVTMEGGEIERGDHVAPSSTPGIGMKCEITPLDTAESFNEYREKAEENRECRESSVGKALEPAKQKTKVLVKTGTS